MFKELIIEKRQLCLNSIHENSLTKRRIYEVTWADYIRDFMYIQDTNYTNYVNITRISPVAAELRRKVKIFRRAYKVTAPNSLWHIDSNLKLAKYDYHTYYTQSSIKSPPPHSLASI